MNADLPAPVPAPELDVLVQTPGADLEGLLTLPAAAQGIVLFAHGSGSSRFSPRNRFVAEILVHAKLGTLLMDLLTNEEDVIDARTRQFRFDIELLAQRLIGAVDWLSRQEQTRELPMGLFGASTGSAAALRAAAARSELVRAVVSRGGRPDLAGIEALTRVAAPTLLIVGSDDKEVISLNAAAAEQMRCPRELVLVPGASHLFEEAGTLLQASNLARDWFLQHFSRQRTEQR